MTTKWFAVIAASNLVFGITTHAQTGDVGAEVEVAVAVTREKPGRPEKPERPERPKKEALGQDVKELVADFRTKIAEFHAEQKELVKKLKSASAQERDEIREQMKQNREEFHAAKEEIRDSVKNVSDELKDHATKLSAELKSENKGGRMRK